MFHKDERNYNGKSVKVEDIRKALKYKLEENGHSVDEGMVEEAERVTNFFGFDDMIIDNILEQEDRELFYFLEDMDLLYTENEEERLYNGREWRINYWLYNKEEIFEAAEKYRGMKEEKEVEGSGGYAKVYDEVPDEVWSDR